MTMNAIQFDHYKRIREQTGYSARDVLAIVRTRDAEHRGLIRFTWEYVIGYCVKCHRVKQVRVTHPTPGHIQQGVCSQCEEKK